MDEFVGLVGSILVIQPVSLLHGVSIEFSYSIFSKDSIIYCIDGSRFF
jgi:hypothetical protein